jgi:hypothetical protein
VSRSRLFALAALWLAAVPLLADQKPDRGPDAPADPEKLEKFRCPKPTEFASVFSLGYAGDEMPKDDEAFDKLLGTLKGAGFNVVHCAHTDARLRACAKHGIKMMVDLLEPERHVYKAPEAAKALCDRLRGDPAVWGYHIWSDSIGKTTDGRKRDINNVRTWDPTHPAFCGTYRVSGVSRLTNPDAFGYYDYHWKRGRDLHFPHLLRFAAWARERDAVVVRWIEADAGAAGEGNASRSRYTVNTSVACGVKAVIWFLGGQQLNVKTLELTPLGRDAARVNAALVPLRAEIAALGNPVAVYSTEVTRTMNNDPLPGDKKSAMPPGLERAAFPADFWAAPAGGEFVCGVFKHPADKDAPDRLFVANHNPYAAQDVVLKLAAPRKVSRFSRTDAKWEPLEVRDARVSFTLGAGGGELLKVE